jgi:transcriptional antiterminator RfaH
MSLRAGAHAARIEKPGGAMRRWYLIHSKPGAEAEAQRHLQRQQYQTYLPRLVQRLRRRGRVRLQVGALFPRYLFLRLEEGRQCLTPVRSTSGVASVVRIGARFATVPDEIIDELRSREDPDTGFHSLCLPERLERGAQVRIDGGAFSGLEGVFERAEGAERVVVLLTLLGEERPVQLPAELVSAA